jgi:hypothetical protein
MIVRVPSKQKTTELACFLFAYLAKRDARLTDLSGDDPLSCVRTFIPLDLTDLSSELLAFFPSLEHSDGLSE